MEVELGPRERRDSIPSRSTSRTLAPIPITPGPNVNRSIPVVRDTHVNSRPSSDVHILFDIPEGGLLEQEEVLRAFVHYMEGCGVGESQEGREEGGGFEHG